MSLRPGFAARLRCIVKAGAVSIRRARAQGLSWPAIVRKGLAAALRGPRSFARAVTRFAQERSATVQAVGYEEWCAREMPCAVPDGAAGTVSIIMPVCNTPVEFLREAYASVVAQRYSKWELCIHDDASDRAEVKRELNAIALGDARVRLSRSETRIGIAAATNAALQLATGRWVAFLDHDDVLHPDALAECVGELQRSGAWIVYTDHDQLDLQGRRCAPFFKPDWSPDLFMAQMYLGHLIVMERRLLVELGGLRPRMDGAQDYDLLLRCVAHGAKVAHVPRVLYHWRQHANSTASNPDAKPYAHEAGRRALQDFVDAIYPGACVRDGVATFCYDVRFHLPVGQRSSIIIPTRDSLALLNECVASIRKHTRGDYEIIVVDNGSREQATLRWLDAAAQAGELRVLKADVPFNWSALNNLAAKQARGDVLVFLNNDTEVITADWLERLAENALRTDAGVCGPLLLYPDRSIQHAGVVVGMGGWADHVFKGHAPVHQQHLFVSPVLRRNVLALTGACMAIEKRKFDALGGFDETFQVCGSDVELCLRAYERGLLNVYVPEAQVVHHESKTRDPRAIPETDFVRSAEAYGRFRTEGDPFYNPNLDPMTCSPTLRPLA